MSAAMTPPHSPAGKASSEYAVGVSTMAPSPHLRLAESPRVVSGDAASMRVPVPLPEPAHARVRALTAEPSSEGINGPASRPLRRPRRTARRLLSRSVEPLSGDARAHDDDTPLPSLDTVDALPPTALPAFVADIAARQAHLAAVQSRVAARLASAPVHGDGTERRIAPGQRINAKQLAARMGRSLDYVYRHARRWPFTVRDGGRSVAFDEAGYVKWERAKQRGTIH